MLKTLPRLFSFLLLAFAFSIPFSYGAATITIGKEFNKREIKARIGEQIRVNLEALGAAGYVWEIQNLDAEHFETLQEKTDDAPSPADITGAPVKKTWLFKTKKAGKTELRFIHHRPWEDEKSASDTFVVRVLIVR